MFDKKKKSDARRDELIYKILCEKRIICIHCEINDKTAASFIAQMLFLQSESSNKPITLDIDSEGGSVTAGLAIYDTIQDLSNPVKTHCSGNASGMALSLLAAGAEGQRTSCPKASLVITSLWSGSQGKAIDIEIQEREMRRLTEILVDMLSKRVKVSRTTVKQDYDDGLEMSPVEALAYGIIDGIKK
jgi:ATP-dependent Clp protease, protease subunit